MQLRIQAGLQKGRSEAEKKRGNALFAADAKRLRAEAAAASLDSDTDRLEALAKAEREWRAETAKALEAFAASTDDLASKAKEREIVSEVHNELAELLAKEIVRWNGGSAPFIVPRAGEIGAVGGRPGTFCSTSDIDSALKAMPPKLAWIAWKEIEEEVGNQWFLTGSLSNSSSDFKYAETPRAINDDTGLVGTESSNEHNYSGRLGVSLLSGGSALDPRSWPETGLAG